MIYLHYFETESDYETGRAAGYREPWLSYTEETDSVKYNKSRDEKVATLSIPGPTTFTGETYACTLLKSGVIVDHGTVWSIVSGGTYATISSDGVITVLSAASGSNITVRAEYLDMMAEKVITVMYLAGTTASSRTESETVTTSAGTVERTTTTTEITDQEGNTTTSVTVTELITTTNESGETVFSEVNATLNPDGSSNSATTNYDAEGTLTDAVYASGDTDGNVDTQGVEYSEEGVATVTAYTVDTTNNPEGVKTMNGDGTNTEYYAFDITHGFVLNIHFTIPFNNQPPNQNESHHNILTMKRATPSPWYGFQIRQSGTNKYIQLGTQFATGDNTNTTINGSATTSANTSEYNLTITYSPTASKNSFVCYDNLAKKNVYTSNAKFPDIDELKYLRVTIGCAMDENGNPFRYSNINLINFDITRT